jgi:hypothetical protein
MRYTKLMSAYHKYRAVNPSFDNPSFDELVLLKRQDSRELLRQKLEQLENQCFDDLLPYM